jgi:hypothetical protein
LLYPTKFTLILDFWFEKKPSGNPGPELTIFAEIFFEISLSASCWLEKARLNVENRGPMLCFLKIFWPKNLAKILAFLTQNRAKLCKNLIITLVFGENANFFAKNW